MAFVEAGDGTGSVTFPPAVANLPYSEDAPLGTPFCAGFISADGARGFLQCVGNETNPVTVRIRSRLGQSVAASVHPGGSSDLAYQGTADQREFIRLYIEANRRGDRGFVESMILPEALNAKGRDAAISLLVPHRPTEFSGMSTVPAGDQTQRLHSYDHLPEDVEPRYVLYAKHMPEVSRRDGRDYAIEQTTYFPVVEKDGVLYIGAFYSPEPPQRGELELEEEPDAPAAGLVPAPAEAGSLAGPDGLQFRWVADEHAREPTGPSPYPTVPSGEGWLYLLPEVVMDGRDLAGAELASRDGSEGTIHAVLTEQGRVKFATATVDHIGRRLAIVWNGRVVSAPTVRSRIDEGRVSLTGHFAGSASSGVAQASCL